MKKIVTSAAFILTTAFSVAQDSYTIKMTTKVEGLPAEYAAFAESEVVTYIKGDKIKSETSSMMGSQIRLFDGKLHTFLSDAMGKKSGYTATTEEMEAVAKTEKGEAKPKIEYTTEKKTIAGYECTKAVITSMGKDGKENKIITWVTDKIKFDMSKAKKGSKNDMFDFGDLKGYPLEMYMVRLQEGKEIKITISTTEVSTKALDDSTFVASTAGYTMSTYKEEMEKMKSMRGGN